MRKTDQDRNPVVRGRAQGAAMTGRASGVKPAAGREGSGGERRVAAEVTATAVAVAVATTATAAVLRLVLIAKRRRMNSFSGFLARSWRGSRRLGQR